jgi:hypothetical protein
MESPGELGATMSFDSRGVRATTARVDPLPDTTVYQRPDPRHPRMSPRMRTAATALQTALDHLRAGRDPGEITDGIVSVVLHVHDLILNGSWTEEDESRQAYGTWASTIPLDGTPEQFRAARDEVVHAVAAAVERVHQWAMQPRPPQHAVLPDVRSWVDEHTGAHPPDHGDELAQDPYGVSLMQSTAQAISHAHQQLRPVIGDALTHLQQKITELRQATDPAVIRNHVLDVLTATNHALFGHEWHHGLADEHGAWESLDPHTIPQARLTSAPEAIAEAAQRLHDMVHGWITSRSMSDDWMSSRDAAVGQLASVATTARTSH